MQMDIHNPNDLNLIDYRKVKPLQGDLKDLTNDNAERLKRVFDRRGFRQPLNLWKKGNEMFLLDGHQRVRVMKEFDMNDKGSYAVPYFVTEAKDEAEAKMQILEISSQYGTITQEGYDEFAVELPEAELPDVYFDNLFHDKSEPNVEEDEPPEVSEGDPISKLGEIYQLGRHRLMCGDSTNLGQVSDLMDGESGLLGFTDPPYGINIVANSPRLQEDKKLGSIGGSVMATVGKYSPVMNDDTTDTAKQSYEIAKEFCTEHIIWGGNYFTDFLPPSRGWVIWDKRNGETTFADAELAWTSFDKSVRLHSYLWSGMRREGDRKIEGSLRFHPTQKPVGLIIDILKNWSDNNKVLDLFGGSGSTLIACEQLGRICFMMELSEQYCDVIRKRYWKLLNDGNEEGWEVNTPKINT